MAKGNETGSHPGRQVGRERYTAPLERSVVHSDRMRGAAIDAENAVTGVERGQQANDIMRNMSRYSRSEQLWALRESGDYDRD